VPAIDSYCLTCASITGFEQPPCADRHGRDCPERLCVRCGAAVLVGSWPPVRRGVVPAPRRRAPIHVA